MLENNYRKLRILALVLAGGKGERLYPLTKYRTKPAVPFGGKYRIVDFVLSNLINSGLFSIYILTQYKAQSLTEHIEAGWQLGSGLRSRDFFITIAPAQMWTGEHWFLGTADAVYQNLHLISSFDADIVVILSADHIYKVDISQILHYHFEKKADVTVSAVPVPKEKCSQFGIIEVDEKLRVKKFLEKPKENPPLLKGRENYCFASMGNYIFKREVLENALLRDARNSESLHDFGQNILPSLCKNTRVYAYDFSTNKIQGEKEPYWRDVGTIEEYFYAHRDILGTEPRLNIHNPKWVIRTVSYRDPPSFIEKGSIVENSLISEGVRIYGGKVINSVLGRNCIVEKGAIIENSIIHYGVRIGKGAIIKKCIIDKFVQIPEGENPRENLKPEYVISDKEKILVISSPPPVLRIRE